MTATCTEARGSRGTYALTAVDADGRLLGRGTTGQAVLPADVLVARLRRVGDDPAGA
ncbi:MAG TPA: hypothetical protein VER97_07115 [Geodermatophilus sp.]|nr:hypothetical protein [Geodermatophilus sp.]